MIERGFKNDNLQSRTFLFLSTTIVFIFTGLSITGIYWGWVDDVIYANNFSSLYSPLPIFDPDYFVGLTNIILYFSKVQPKVGWLGVFLSLQLFCCFILWNILILKLLRKHFCTRLFWVAMGALTVSAFIFFFFRLNFTTIAVLSLSLGFFNLFIARNPITLAFSFYVLLTGLLIRWNIGVPLLVLYLTTVFFCSFTLSHFKKKTSRIAIYSSIAFIILIALRTTTQHPDAINFNVDSRLEWLVQDGYMIGFNSVNETWTDEELLKLEAIASWNTQDSEQITPQTYVDLFSKSYTGLESLFRILQVKCHILLYSLSRYEGFQSSLNWGWKVLSLLLLIITTSLFTFIYHRQNRVAILGSGLLVYMFIFSIVVFAKLEDRFIIPLLLVLLLACLLMSNSISISLNYQKYLGTALIIFSIVSFYNTIQQSSVLQQDLNHKRALITTVENNFKGRTLLLDTYTTYYFQTSPFKTISLEDIKLVLGLHYGRNNFKSLRDYFFKEGEKVSYANIFPKLADNPEYIFFYRDINASFMNKWNDTFYDLPYTLQQERKMIPPASNYYLWDQHRYRFYTLRNKFSE